MPWMVVVSQQGKQDECRKSLCRELGAKCYMPVYRDFVVRGGRKVWSDHLLLGRYFFVRQSPDFAPGSILANRRVSGMLMWPDGIKPALVRDSEVDELRSREDKHGHIPKAGRREFVKDQRVVPQIGIFAGHEGKFVRVGRGECDIAVLSMFGQDTKIEFAPGVLRAA